MTIPDQVGKVATSTVDALKSNPGLLVLVMLQLATLAMIYVVNDRNNARRQERELILLDRCLDRTDAILKEDQP